MKFNEITILEQYYMKAIMLIMLCCTFGIIIGNLLDNAIEACCLMEKKEKRFIDVKVHSKNNNIHIYIKNSKNNWLIKEKTLKEDKKNHGIWIKSIKKIIDKYNGFMENKDCGEYYEVSIMLWSNIE